MAEINLEKKKTHGSLGWLWALLALLAIGGLIVWFVVANDDEETDERISMAQEQPPEEAQPGEQPEAQARGPEQQAGIPIGTILTDASAWEGKTVSGRAEVESVPTDRGFWIEEGGERLFVVLDPKQEETPYEVQEQSQVDIRQATVRASDYADELDIQLSPETREILAQQDVFLVADGPAVEVAQR